TADGIEFKMNSGNAGTGSLTGVTFDGKVLATIGRYEVRNGLTLAAGTLVRLDGLGSTPKAVLAFIGDQTLGGTGELRFDSINDSADAIRAEGGATLTIGPGITIHNTANTAGTVGGVSGQLIAQGTISSEASGKTVFVLGGAITNDGTM